MLHHRVIVFALPLHGVELAGLLFADYIQSSLFHLDVAEAFGDVNGWLVFFRSGFQPSTFLSFYSRLISERLLFRLLECSISAMCMYAGTDLCKDAVVFHYIYPIVRDYRYGRFWCTRLLWWVGRSLTPGFLRRRPVSRGTERTAAAVPTSSKNSCGSSYSSAGDGVPPPPPRLFEHDLDEAESTAAFLSSPPPPSRTDPFENMPDTCRDALRYFLYCYQTRPYYTALVSGLITDASLFTADQVLWATIFHQERTKSTSTWRLWKPYLSDAAMVCTQSILGFVARVAGVLIGQKLCHEPTGGGIFWGEHLTLLLLSPAINIASAKVGMAVRAALEERHPRTVEDEMEDKRLEDEAEEAARAQAATARAAFSFTSGTGGGKGGGGSSTSGAGSAEGHTAGGASSIFGGASTGPNYYEVLGITEQAREPEIKKAYRALALQNHPDRVRKDPQVQQQAREHMSVLNDAYDTLMDADKRSQYDATRRFAEGSEFFKKLESMSAAQLAGVCTAAMVGLSTLMVVSAYGQYLTIFQRVTALGRGPLQLFT